MGCLPPHGRGSVATATPSSHVPELPRPHALVSSFSSGGVNPGILLDQAERNPPPSTTDGDERGEIEIGSIWWPLLSQVGAGKEQLENGGFSVKTRGCSIEKRFPKVWGQVPEKGERGRADKTSGQHHKKLRRYKTTYKCKILLTLWGSSPWFQCIE